MQNFAFGTSFYLDGIVAAMATMASKRVLGNPVTSPRFSSVQSVMWTAWSLYIETQPVRGIGKIKKGRFVLIPFLWPLGPHPKSCLCASTQTRQYWPQGSPSGYFTSLCRILPPSPLQLLCPPPPSSHVDIPRCGDFESGSAFIGSTAVAELWAVLLQSGFLVSRPTYIY